MPNSPAKKSLGTDMLTAFLLGFGLYLTYAWTNYYEPFKNSKWFFPVGLGLALLANAVWLYIAKNTSNPPTLLLRALYWDVIVLASSLIIPFAIFGTKVSMMQGAGIFLIVAGIVLTKMG